MAGLYEALLVQQDLSKALHGNDKLLESMKAEEKAKITEKV